MNNSNQKDSKKETQFSENDHIPVLIDQIIEHFITHKSSENSNDQEYKFLDLTFGAGGYSKKLAKNFPNSEIFCFDQDPITKKYFDKLLAESSNQLHFFESNFSNSMEILKEKNIGENYFDGIFFDLGVSSMQLDDKKRGFSFYSSKENPESDEEIRLDMRMNKNSSDDHSFSAYEFINYASEKEIADIIFYYGEEREARKIARNIIKQREANGEIETTKQLADIISKIIPYKKNNLKISIHPATKTFQAIRIHVNKEFDHLVLALQKNIKLLKSGGIMFVVSFHSLEDRIVKNFFSYMEKSIHTDFEIKKHFPLILENENEFFNEYKFINSRKTFQPSELEIKENIRSRSAKMRFLKRV
jgi:16S rRNA (cytosine1402-N4)-methyltransferase